MFWTNLEWESWTVGIEFFSGVRLHLGPLKIHYIKRGSRLHRDFQIVKKQKDARWDA